MKKIVVYTSQTGNTRKVAEVIADELGCEAVNFIDAESINFSEFDYIAVGYYIDKGGAQAHFKRFVNENIKDKEVGLFITLGAEPEGEHGENMLANGRAWLEQNGNRVTREYICQGAIDPAVIEQMKELALKMGDKAKHQITPEREARWAAAASHPDENDLLNARAAFKI